MKNNKKYTKEFKMNFAKEVVEANSALLGLAAKYGVCYTTAWIWVNNYKKFGDKAFPGNGHYARKKKEKPESIRERAPKNNYSQDFKLMVAILAMVGDTPQMRIAQKYGVTPSKVSEWKKILKNEGPKLFERTTYPEIVSIVPQKESFDWATLIIYGLMVCSAAFIYVLIRA